jgi:hypothetical protein
MIVGNLLYLIAVILWPNSNALEKGNKHNAVNQGGIDTFNNKQKIIFQNRFIFPFILLTGYHPKPI